MSERNAVTIKLHSEVSSGKPREEVGNCTSPQDLQIIGKRIHGEGYCPVVGRMILVDTGYCWENCVYNDNYRQST